MSWSPLGTRLTRPDPGPSGPTADPTPGLMWCQRGSSTTEPHLHPVSSESAASLARRGSRRPELTDAYELAHFVSGSGVEHVEIDPGRCLDSAVVASIPRDDLRPCRDDSIGERTHQAPGGIGDEQPDAL